MLASRLVIGTRRSRLALAQAECVRGLLAKLYPKLDLVLKEVVTKGDTLRDVSLPSIGGKGLFTAELEAGLLRGEIDLAVHSLKDLPTEIDPAFVLAAIPERASPFDVLVTRDRCTLENLPHAALVGSSSPRRAAQLRRLRPDLKFSDIRGNVETRIEKVHNGLYAATVLAEAGLQRLGLEGVFSQRFTLETMLPAPGQGALAVQCLATSKETLQMLSHIDSMSARTETTAERSFMSALEAGCSTPIGALARLVAGTLSLSVCNIRPDGTGMLLASGAEAIADDPIRVAQKLGRALAEKVRLP